MVFTAGYYDISSHLERWRIATVRKIVTHEGIFAVPNLSQELSPFSFVALFVL